MQLAKQLSKSSWAVLIELDRLILTTRGHPNPIKLINQLLSEAGISPKYKAQGLRRLEELGIVTVVRRGLQAPMVTHSWFPIRL
jgi:hypothetical protein